MFVMYCHHVITCRIPYMTSLWIKCLLLHQPCRKISVISNFVNSAASHLHRLIKTVKPLFFRLLIEETWTFPACHKLEKPVCSGNRPINYYMKCSSAVVIYYGYVQGLCCVVISQRQSIRRHVEQWHEEWIWKVLLQWQRTNLWGNLGWRRGAMRFDGWQLPGNCSRCYTVPDPAGNIYLLSSVLTAVQESLSRLEMTRKLVNSVKKNNCAFN